jgi:hypothetical protein
MFPQTNRDVPDTVLPDKLFRFMVVKKYLTVLSGKYPANLYPNRIPDSAGRLNFTGYWIPVSGKSLQTKLLYVLSPCKRTKNLS